MEILRAELEAVKNSNLEASENLQIAEKENVQLLEAINLAQSQVVDLTVFDPENLAYLRQEYSLLALTHLWRPLSLKGKTQIWIYDGTIQLRLHQVNDLYNVNVSILESDAMVILY